MITYLAAHTEHERNRGKRSTQESIVHFWMRGRGQTSEDRESRGSRYLAWRIRNLRIGSEEGLLIVEARGCRVLCAEKKK